jgi:hypothetical protein
MYKFRVKNKTLVAPWPLYNPVVSPAHFSLFSKLKASLKGYQFESVKERWNFQWSS